MKISEARLEFVQTWGSLGTSWGIPKSMAQIHGLLLTHREELTAEEIMEQVKISRGNVNINLRELTNWKLVSKQNRLGERKEFFKAEHNVMTLARNIISERKKRELEPVRDFLRRMQVTSLEGNEKDVAHFHELMKDLADFVDQLDKLSELAIKMNDNALFKKMIKLMT